MSIFERLKWTARRGKERPEFIPSERCGICPQFQNGECSKRRLNSKDCRIPLRFDVVCPRCGTRFQDEREWGQDKVYYHCTGKVRSGHPCDCKFELSFHTADSRDAQAMEAWKRGEGDQYTDASFSMVRRERP